MSQPIPGTLPSAAYCFRIDLIPSRIAAAVWWAWLALVCAVVLSATALPWLARIVLCLSLWLPGNRCIRSFVLLDGPHAVRSIEWSAEGEFGVCLGPQLTRCPAALGAGCFRLGLESWVLRFVTPQGVRPVLIAGAIQDEERFRRLSPLLTAHLRRPSGRCSGATVTIRPKV